MRKLLSVEEVAPQIRAGERLLLAGDEQLLRQLPMGNWIGGTIPYFIDEEGGVLTRDKLFVSTLPPEVVSYYVRFYDDSNLPAIVADEPSHGFSYVIIPAFAKIHQSFAKNVPNYPGIYDRPLIGWIAGVALDEVGTRLPKVVDGRTGQWSSDKALCLHAVLTENVMAEIGIVNPFTQGDGDIITVSRPGFDVIDAFVNGEPVNLAAYFVSKYTDLRLPLVANYSGAMVNVSIKSVNLVDGRIEFYAPLFPQTEYKLAVPVADYAAAFAQGLSKISPEPILSMNCILNYVYGNLEGRCTGHFKGPITFGEIAYGLLNQTLVYMVLRQA